MEENLTTEPKQKLTGDETVDQECGSLPKMGLAGIRSSTRLLNKQKPISGEAIPLPVSDAPCKCGLSTCDSCPNLPPSTQSLLTKKRDFWTVQEQSDFFDGLKLYGKEINSIFIHMKSVAKRRARIMTGAIQNVSSDSSSQISTAKIKTKEQIRHFYYRKLQLCQRLVGTGTMNCPSLQNQPRDVREVYVLLCYDALKKIFRDKLDPRLARPDFALHLNQMISSGSTVVRVGRKGRFRAKAPVCQALRSWNISQSNDGRGSGSGDLMDGESGGSVNLGFLATGTQLTNLPSLITVHFVPANNFSWSYVQSVAHNPRVAVSASSGLKLLELQKTLEEKWRPKLGVSDAVHEQIGVPEKINLSFRLSTNEQEGQGEDCVNEKLPSSDEMIHMSLVEILLLSRREPPKEVDNILRLEYAVEQGGLPPAKGKPVLSSALSKLVYFASLRMKMLSQQTAATPKAQPLSRIDEEAFGSNAIEVDMRKPGQMVTPRRRAQRKVQGGFMNPPNVVSGNQPAVTVPGSAPTTTATAVTFIEQLKELRGKTRKNRTTTVNSAVNSSQHAGSDEPPVSSSEQSPGVVQRRRLLPKPVPVGLVESQMRFQSLPQTLMAGQNEASDKQVVVNSALDPNVNIVITPLQHVQPNSGHFQISVDTSQAQAQPAATSFVSAFPDASLDISLPGESTLVELLKPPTSTHQASTSVGLTAPRPNAVLDLDSASIINARPLSPNATAALDISFGDPSLSGLGGLLSSADVATAAALVGKNSSMAPWLMQETSSMSFFETNAAGPFDDSSFLMPSSNNTAGNPPVSH